MKAISYSLFGYNKKTPDNCFEFNTYMRGLMINVRFNRVIYPNWVNVVNLDSSTYNSPFKPIFDWLQNKGFVELNICPDDQPLCLAMLWRLKPVFFTNKDTTWRFTHVLCRDVDSICTYREAQAVAQWIQEDKAIHCITDSISHNIPMMGGMIGFRPAHLSSRLSVNSWDALMNKGKFDYNRKGSDQDFLNKYVYPNCAESSTEHYVLGMVHNLPEGNGRHYSIPDIQIDVDPIFKVTNDCAGHIGAAGYYEPPTLKFLHNTDPYNYEYSEIEKQFPQLFFWA